LAFDGLIVTYSRTNLNPTIMLKWIFQPTVRSFSTKYQALGFLGIEICPVGMNFSSKNKNASAHLRFWLLVSVFSRNFFSEYRHNGIPAVVFKHAIFQIHGTCLWENINTLLLDLKRHQCARLETSHFCIIKCAKDTLTPFYVAEVISNNSESLTVQWWAPSAISKSKAGKYHNHAFEAQTTKHRIQNRQKGAPQWRLKPHLDTVHFNTVYFGFTKMTRDRRLPAEVLRKLRSLALISKNIKIKRM